eukprot:scaffold17827_cov69-Phaeocystis_antarctica.AAC.2
MAATVGTTAPIRAHLTPWRQRKSATCCVLPRAATSAAISRSRGATRRVATAPASMANAASCCVQPRDAAGCTASGCSFAAAARSSSAAIRSSSAAGTSRRSPAPHARSRRDGARPAICGWLRPSAPSKASHNAGPPCWITTSRDRRHAPPSSSRSQAPTPSSSCARRSERSCATPPASAALVLPSERSASSARATSKLRHSVESGAD